MNNNNSFEVLKASARLGVTGARTGLNRVKSCHLFHLYKYRSNSMATRSLDTDNGRRLTFGASFALLPFRNVHGLEVVVSHTKVYVLSVKTVGFESIFSH